MTDEKLTTTHNNEGFSLKNSSPALAHSRQVFMLLILLIFIFLGLGISMIWYTRSTISREYFKILGSKAASIAITSSKSLSISDEELDELCNTPFSEIETKEVSLRIKHIFNSEETVEAFSDIQCAYIIHEINETKYRVTEENKTVYKMPIGTELNMMRLVDVIIDEKEGKKTHDYHDYHDDRNRYSFKESVYANFYNNRTAGYFISNEDEWGNHISGVAPIYTSEGNYIGLFGVGIHASNIKSYTNGLTGLIVSLFMVPSLILCTVLIIMYAKYVKVYRESAFTDELTKLYNRTYFNHMAEKIVGDCIRYKKPLSIIMVDIDYFKKFNDRYKHQEGDYIINKVAQIIKSSTNRSFDLAFRYGGDEFILMLPDTDYNGAITISNRIETTVRELSVPHEDSECLSKIVSVSQGIYSGVPTCNTEHCIYRFVKNADTALYAAKLKGRNQFITFHDARREGLI